METNSCRFNGRGELNEIDDFKDLSETNQSLRMISYIRGPITDLTLQNKMKMGARVLSVKRKLSPTPLIRFYTLYIF